MDFLTDLGKKITESAKTVSKKSENLVELTRISLSITNEEEKVKRMLLDLGTELYKKYLDGESFGEYFDAKCADTKEIEDNIAKMREKILQIKGNKACKACSAVIDLDVNFCPNCGEKVATVFEETEEPIIEETEVLALEEENK